MSIEKDKKSTNQKLKYSSKDSYTNKYTVVEENVKFYI